MSHEPAWTDKIVEQEFVVKEDGIPAYVLTLKSSDMEPGTTCSVVWQGGVDRRAAARQLMLAGLAIATGLRCFSESFSVELMHKLTNALYDVPNPDGPTECPF